MKKITATIVLLALLAVGVQYATKNDRTVSAKEVFTIHDQGKAPGWEDTPLSVNELAKKHDDYGICFQIPINVAALKGNRSILYVQIPDGYGLMPELDHSSTHAFVKKEELNNQFHSEMIAVHSAPGACRSSAVLMQGTKETMYERAQKVKVLEEKTEQCNGYTKSSIAFLLNNDESYLYVVRYFSGPYDAGHYLYTMELDATMTLERALEKIANFEKKYVTVMLG